MAPDKEPTDVNDDLEKDMQFSGDEYVNMEGENHSTATEGTLKEVDENKKSNSDASEVVSADDTTKEAKKSEEEAKNDETSKPTLAEDESIDKDAVTS